MLITKERHTHKHDDALFYEDDALFYEDGAFYMN